MRRRAQVGPAVAGKDKDKDKDKDKGLAAGLDPLRDLTIPEPGSTTAAAVLSAALRRLLRDLGALLHPSRPGSADERRLRAELSRAVLAAKRSAPGALASALRRPDVGVWIRCLRSGATATVDRGLGLRRLAWSLARSLVCVDGFPRGFSLRIPGPLPPRLCSVAAAEVFEVRAGVAALELSAEGLRSLSADGRWDARRSWSQLGDRSRFAEIAGSIVLAGVDDNPLAEVEAHPDKQGNALSLGGEPTTAWTAALADALELIGEHLPELRREIDLVVQQFVPVGYDPERHLSASYRESIGTVYLSLHPQRMTMVEAVIHEFSHNKLNALFEVDDVLVNAFTSLHASPVRPDRRPLHGVLFAVHAFLPVARLYEEMLRRGDPRLDAGAGGRLRSIIAGNHRGATVILEHAEPTPLGAGLVAEIARWDRHFAEIDGASSLA